MATHAGAAAASTAAGGWRWAAYELVLRRLPADDHLCTALACRAFRGILYAVTEPTTTRSKKKGAKRAKQKKRELRFKTSPRAIACSAGRLSWAHGLGEAAPPWLRRWDRATCAIVARHGCVAGLRWARANGCDWDSFTCYSAAEGGHLEVLQWARANGCDWDYSTCTAAAEGGHLAVLQWARANGCPE